MKRLIFFLLVVFVFSASCKKDQVPVQQCRIITAVYSNGSNSIVYNISYNSEGLPSLITVGDMSITVSYFGNLVLSVTRDASGVISRDSITRDDMGNLINIKRVINASGTNWSNQKLFYDGNNNLLKEIETFSWSAFPNTTIYTVINGDIITESAIGYTNNYSYYTDKSYRKGDYNWWGSLVIYGVEGYKQNAHLLKSISQSGGSNLLLSYEINEKGNIDRVTGVGTYSSFSLTYQYECD